jgi:glycosyltransferase involved in cell wall biosynthesis
MPTVSVVIPAYNQAQYLTEAIQSVLAQTYRDFEIIVVDDGSTDDTPIVAKQFSDAVRYVRQDNQGLAGARNTGIHQAQGKYIGLLDSDDQWLPAFLETMMALIEQHPDATVYYCYAQFMDANGQDLPQTTRCQGVPTNALNDTLLRANFIIPSTVVLRRSVVEAAGLFDQTLRSCEDWDLWIRLVPKHTFINRPECLVRYRVHGNSLSGNVAGMQQAAMAVVEKNFGVDDGRWQTWSEEKRRAYGGIYRYHALIPILRQNDWSACAHHLRRAFQVDPSLAVDLDLFYELALGSQPVGYRGTTRQLDLESNVAQIKQVLADVFCEPMTKELASLRYQAYGIAYYTLGLAAYNTAQFSLSRRYLFLALRFRPDLWHDTRVFRTLMKLFVPHSILRRIKSYDL